MSPQLAPHKNGCPLSNLASHVRSGGLFSGPRWAQIHRVLAHPSHAVDSGRSTHAGSGLEACRPAVCRRVASALKRARKKERWKSGSSGSCTEKLSLSLSLDLTSFVLWSLMGHDPNPKTSAPGAPIFGSPHSGRLYGVLRSKPHARSPMGRPKTTV